MQKLLLIVAALVALPASAYVSSNTGKHIVSPMLGFMGPGANTITDSINGTDTPNQLSLSGFYGIGVDYEFQMKDELSLGGMFRYYSTSDSVGRTDTTDTAFLLGGIAHAQLINTDKWRGYLGSGLTLIKVTVKSGSSTWSPAMTLGFPVAMGIGYKFSDSMTFGIEHLQVMALGDKVNGWPVSDFMFRLSLVL